VKICTGKTPSVNGDGWGWGQIPIPVQISIVRVSFWPVQGLLRRSRLTVHVALCWQYESVCQQRAPSFSSEGTVPGRPSVRPSGCDWVMMSTTQRRRPVDDVQCWKRRQTRWRSSYIILRRQDHPRSLHRNRLALLYTISHNASLDSLHLQGGASRSLSSNARRTIYTSLVGYTSTSVQINVGLR